MPKYTIRNGSPIPKKMAQKYGEYLTEALPRRLGHAPTTDEIWQDAKRNPHCPYRKYFQWDKEKAAVSFWRVQARNLANSIIEITVIDGRRESVNAMFSVYSGPKGPAQYVSGRMVFKDPFMAKQVTDAAARELEYWNLKYRQYATMSGARRLVKRAVATIR